MRLWPCCFCLIKSWPAASLSVDAPTFTPTLHSLPLGQVPVLPGLQSETVPDRDEIESWANDLALQCPLDEGDSDDEYTLHSSLSRHSRWEIINAKSQQNPHDMPISERVQGKQRAELVPTDPRRVRPQPIVDDIDDADGDDTTTSSWLQLEPVDKQSGNEGGNPEEHEYNVLQIPAKFVRRDMLLHIVGPFEEDLQAKLQFEVCRNITFPRRHLIYSR
jgi:hypothetical protein